MAISKAQKAEYDSQVRDHKQEADALTKDITALDAKARKMSNIKSYVYLEKVLLHLKLIRTYLTMNDVSVSIMGIKNDTFLNNARKEYYKVLQSLEEVLGADVDRTLRENDKFLVEMSHVNPKQMLFLAQKINDSFFSLRDKVGENSKWKWSFVELQARLAVIIKNMTSFSDIARLRDPRSDFYYERRDMMDMCKSGLAEAAKQYRTKYELSGKAREDLQKSIELLSALRKIHVLFGEDTEATKLKNTIDAARQALEAEDKSSDKKKKKKKKK